MGIRHCCLTKDPIMSIKYIFRKSESCIEFDHPANNNIQLVNKPLQRGSHLKKIVMVEALHFKD